MVEIEGLKPSGRFISWQPINFKILACSYFFILLSSYIFWNRNKQKQRIIWKQMLWFRQTWKHTKYVNFYSVTFIMMKYTFCRNIFMNFHYKVYIKLKMIVEWKTTNLKSKEQHLKSVDTITPCYFVDHIFLGIVLLLLSDAIFGFKY